MIATSLVGLFASTVFISHVAGLPLNDIPPESDQDDLFASGNVRAEYSPPPTRPTAAHLPKRTVMTPADAQQKAASKEFCDPLGVARPDIPATAAPLQRRAGIDPEEYLTSMESLWSAFSVTSGSSLVEEISSFMENYTPTGIDAEAFQASLTAVMDGAGEQMADFTAAAGAGWNNLFGDDTSDYGQSVSGVISTNGGTTYWSLSDFVSTWAAMDNSARESWRTLNNYVGTYTDTPAETFSTGVMITGGQGTTYWRSDVWMATVASLSTIDSGMAQVSWTKNNVYSGIASATEVTTGSGSDNENTAGVGVQMFTAGGGTTGSSSSEAGQSSVTSSSETSRTGAGSTSMFSSSSQSTSGSSATDSTHVVSRSLTAPAGSQQTAANEVGDWMTGAGLASCPTKAGPYGDEIVCYRGHGTTPENASGSNSISSASSTSSSISASNSVTASH